MQSECLQLICRGRFEIIKITEELYDAALELFRDSVMKYEKISVACRLLENPEDVKELMSIVKTILKDNISFAARDIKTQQLVALCINRLIICRRFSIFHEIVSTFKTSNMIAAGTYWEELVYSFDIPIEWDIQCYIELTFLSTRPDYQRRGIARSLVNFLLDYAAKLKKNCHEFREQLKGKKPEAVTALFTSRYSRELGKKLGFEILYKVNNRKYFFEGKSFRKIIGEKDKYSSFTAKRL